jgi:hypothetical protein
MCETATTAKTETAGATQGGVAGTTETTPADEIQKLWKMTVDEMASWSPSDKEKGEGALALCEKSFEVAVGEPARAILMASLLMLSLNEKISKVVLTKYMIRDKARFNLTDQDIISLINGVTTFADNFSVSRRMPKGLRDILKEILAEA